MKEIKIIRDLTEKLKKEGNVTPEEADLIYMLRQIYEAYCFFSKSKEHISYRFSLEAADPVPFDFSEAFLNPMAEEFEKWYMTVYNFVLHGRRGNFVTTIPVKDENEKYLFIIDIDDEASKLIRLAEKKLDKNITPEDICSRDKFLTLDIVLSDNKTRYRISRYGLSSLIERKYNDVSFLYSMVEKLDREGDISPEEADMVYMLVKFIQTLHLKYFNGDFDDDIKEQFERLHKALFKWFDVIYSIVLRRKDDIYEGKKYNFLYTLPIEDYEYKYYRSRDVIYYTEKCIQRTLNILPDQFSFAKFSATPSFSDLTGIFVDKNHACYSQRYGVIREAIDIDRRIIFPDPSGISGLLESIKEGKPDYEKIHYLINNDRKINGFAVKIEYLKRKNIFSVCKFCKTGSQADFCITYRKEDREKIERVMDIPDKEIERLSPVVPFITREELLEELLYALEKSVCVLDLLEWNLEEDDSWVDIER